MDLFSLGGGAIAFPRPWVERLIGCMLNPEDGLPRAIGAICREAHWTTYYKLIERANVSVAALSIRLLQRAQPECIVIFGTRH